MANLFQSNLAAYPEVFARASLLTMRQADANNLSINMVSLNGPSGGEDLYGFTYASDCTACLNALKVNMVKVTGTAGDVYINPLNVYNLLTDSSNNVNVYSIFGLTIINFANSTDQINAFNAIYNAVALLSVDLGTVATYAVGDFATAIQGAKADTALQSQVQADWNSITGASMILNKPTLGSASATSSSAYATAAQGALASTALQTAPVTSVAGHTGVVTLSNTDISGLGTAATTAASAYATSAQGALADTAYQSSTPIPYSQLTGTPTIPGAISINSTPTTPPIVTTNVAANGAVLSASKNCQAQYSLNLSSTANIAGSALVIVYLQINPSSSATTGWVTIDQDSNGQALSLAITLQSIQTTSGKLIGMVPIGYSHRILSVITGTGSATYASGQVITQG